MFLISVVYGVVMIVRRAASAGGRVRGRMQAALRTVLAAQRDRSHERQ